MSVFTGLKGFFVAFLRLFVSKAAAEKIDKSEDIPEEFKDPLKDAVDETIEDVLDKVDDCGCDDCDCPRK